MLLINSKFKNKRQYQYDKIMKWYNSQKRVSKTKLSKKLGISRVTLYKLMQSIHYQSFTQYGRNYANYKVPEDSRQKLFDDTIKFLNEINSHRKETTFIPTFITLKLYIDPDNCVSLRTYQNIIKENNFYLPSCRRKTKQAINKKIKRLKELPQHTKIIEEMETIKLQRKYIRKTFPFGDTVEIDACKHPWFGDEKVHLYRAVDAGTGLVLVEHVAQEETSMGYIILLKKLFLKYGKPRLIVTDKRKSFWNGHENKSQSSLICNELEIDIVSSSDPTSKPNVERSFLDAQQWLPLQLFKHKIFNLKDFKRHIDMLTKLHNDRFKKSPGSSPSSFIFMHKQTIEDKVNLWIYRKVTNGNTVSINGEHWVPILNGRRILLQDHAKIQILSNEKMIYYVFWRNQKIELQPLAAKYVNNYHSQAWAKIAFEKRKQISFNNMLDNKRLRLDMKEKELHNMLQLIRKEKEQINSLNAL